MPFYTENRVFLDMIKIDTRDALKTLNHLTKSLTSGEVAKASSLAMNEAIRSGRKEIKDEIRSVYNLATYRIYDQRKEKGLAMTFASVNNPVAKIYAGHIPANLNSFAGTKVSRQGGVKVQIRKGSTKVIPSGFTVKKFYHAKGKQFVTIPREGAVFARGVRGKPGFVWGKSRMPISSLASVSVATAAMAANVAPKYQYKVEQRYAKRIEHQLNRMIEKVAGGNT